MQASSGYTFEEITRAGKRSKIGAIIIVIVMITAVTFSLILMTSWQVTVETSSGFSEGLGDVTFKLDPEQPEHGEQIHVTVHAENAVACSIYVHAYFGTSHGGSTLGERWEGAHQFSGIIDSPMSGTELWVIVVVYGDNGETKAAYDFINIGRVNTRDSEQLKLSDVTYTPVQPEANIDTINVNAELFQVSTMNEFYLKYFIMGEGYSEVGTGPVTYDYNRSASSVIDLRQISTKPGDKIYFMFTAKDDRRVVDVTPIEVITIT